MLITLDAWLVNTTKMGFLGMTAHWIEVKGKEWNMRSEVIGFKALSGAHTGKNLGRYVVGLLTTCQTIEDIHKRHGFPEWLKSEQQLPCVLYFLAHNFIPINFLLLLVAWAM